MSFGYYDLQTKFEFSMSFFLELQAPTADKGGQQYVNLVTLTFELLTSKLVSKLHVTWTIFLPILQFLDLFIHKMDRETYEQTHGIQCISCFTSLNKSARTARIPHRNTFHPTDLYPNRATAPKCKLVLVR